MNDDDDEREGLAEQAAERAQLVDGHMSGPAHYREAERILAGEVVAAGDPSRVMVLDGEALFAAQVHATLALAAAVGTVGSIQGGGATRSAVDDKAWHAVAGEIG